MSAKFVRTPGLIRAEERREIFGALKSVQPKRSRKMFFRYWPELPTDEQIAEAVRFMREFWPDHG
jgi:hypothetical protein